MIMFFDLNLQMNSHKSIWNTYFLNRLKLNLTDPMRY